MEISGNVADNMFLQSTSSRTVSDKLDEIVSVEDFRGSNDYTPAGDLATVSAALASGAKEINFPAREYVLNSAVVPVDSAVTKITGHGTTIKVPEILNAVGLLIVKKQFVYIDGIDFESAGTKGDGLNIGAIRWADGPSYQRVSNGRFLKFSGSAIKVPQCVNLKFDDLDFQDCGAAYEFVWVITNGTAHPCTKVNIRGGYITGCNNGILAPEGGLTDYGIQTAVFEYCGVPNDASFAAINIHTGTGWEQNCYFEANYKNRKLLDAGHGIYNPYALSAALPDTMSWNGVAFENRGIACFTNAAVTAANFIADPTVGSAAQFKGRFGFNTDPVSGFDVHYKSPEIRIRYEANGGNKTDFVGGGGGIAMVGRFGYHVANVPRLTWSVGTTPGLHVEGSGANTELQLNGSKILGPQGAGIANAQTGTEVVTLNAVLAALRTHGLIAS